MNSIQAIKEIIALKGKSIVGSDIFVNLLNDCNAFSEESHCAVSKIFRSLCHDSNVQKIIVEDKFRKNKKILRYEIKSIISDITDKYGFDKDKVADALKKLMIGCEVISDTEEWEALVAQTTKHTIINTSNTSGRPEKQKLNNAKRSKPVNRKRNFRKLLTVAAAATVAVCTIAIFIFKPAEHQETTDDSYPALYFNQEVEVPYTKGKATIPISSNSKKIKILYSSDWCKAKSKKGNILLKWAKNNTSQQRQCEIAVSAGEISKTLTVRQAYNTERSKIKISNITCDFYALKAGQRGLEIQYKINSSGYDNKRFRSVLTFYSTQDRRPLPALDESYSVNGQCGIINELTINNGEQIVKDFIPYSAMLKFPKQSDNTFVDMNIAKYTLKINFKLYEIGSDDTISIYSKDKQIRFQGLDDHETVYATKRTNAATSLNNNNFDICIATWFKILIALICFIVIMATIANA